MWQWNNHNVAKELGRRVIGYDIAPYRKDIIQLQNNKPCHPWRATGKKMFIRLYELAKSEDNQELQKFCTDILETYEKYSINGHIIWKK